MSAYAPGEVIASVRHGELRGYQLQEELDRLWADLRDDPALLDSAARQLQLDPARLRDVEKTPFVFSTPAAGFSGADLLLLVGAWFLKDVLAGLAKDIAKERIRALWNNVVLPALRQRTPNPADLGEFRDATAHRDDGP